jgi:hypothetical protein
VTENAEDKGVQEAGANPADFALGQQLPARLQDDLHAVDTLIHQRPVILRTKLAVLATQLQARLLLRETNLTRIADDLLATDNLLLPWTECVLSSQMPTDLALRNACLERQARLQTEIRTQEVECWRDVALVMNEFLTVWEGLQQSQVRAEFLREQRSEDAA